MLSILRWRWRFFIIFVCVWLHVIALRWRWRLCLWLHVEEWEGKARCRAGAQGGSCPLSWRSTNTCYNTAYTNTNTQRQKYKYKYTNTKAKGRSVAQCLNNISEHFNILLQFHTSLQYLNILRLQVRYIQLQYDVHHHLSRPYNWRPYPTRP